MSLATLQEDSSIEIRPFPKEVMAVLRSLSKEVIAELMATDPAAGKIGAAYFEYLEKAAENSRISEAAYLQIRE
jgi:TRAP-type mannitol/chloroaromatic compound transport system substrate-binding protein